ncbi:MAG: hypothetical protein JJT85_09510 [Chromatiales bacterium]|nr:hypothetical protein [Chromatiales bacterium]
MTDEQRQVFSKLSGGREAPRERTREAFIIAGRRSAKSHIAAATAVYTACIGCELDGTLSRLSRGEIGTVSLLAVDRRQAAVALSYVRGLLESSPLLSAMVAKDAGDSIALTNGTVIEVSTADYRRVRGRTLLAAIMDEVCFWRDESSQNPDQEVYRALQPALATTGGLLLAVSSPYSRKGLAWSRHKKYFGKSDGVLVIQAATADLNPTIDPAIIEAAMQDDPDAAMAEWGGQFRRDIEQIFTHEAVDGVTVPGRRELPPVDGVEYFGFVDPSGGAHDAMTLGISHRQGDVAVLDLVSEIRPPFNPSEAVKEFSDILRRYRLSSVSGDAYAAGWTVEAFRKAGIRYEKSPMTRSEIYSAFLPMVNSGQCELLDDDRLRSQLIGLERKTSRTRIVIDHGPNGADDLINSAAGALTRASLRTAPLLIFEALFDEPDAAALDPPVMRIGW